MFPSQVAVNSIKKSYPQGARVECLFMNDPWSPAPSGTKGTVECVDDIGTVHVRWDNGQRIGAVLGEDSIRRCDS